MAPNDIFCTTCGAQATGSDPVGPMLGSRPAGAVGGDVRVAQATVSAASQATQQRPSAEAPQDPGPPSSTGRKILLVVLTVLAMAAVAAISGYAVLGFLDDDDQSSPFDVEAADNSEEVAATGDADPTTDGADDPPTSTEPTDDPEPTQPDVSGPIDLAPATVGATPHGTEATAAISEMEGQLGPADGDTGWRSDFHLFSPSGTLTSFQSDYVAYRNLCWEPNMLCLTFGRDLGEQDVLAGWSLGRPGELGPTQIDGAPETVDGLTLGSTMTAVEAADPATTFSTGPSGTGTFSSTGYQGIANPPWPATGEPQDQPPDDGATITCLAAGNTVVQQADGPTSACLYDGSGSMPGAPTSNRPLEDQWVSILESLGTDEYTLAEVHGRLDRYNGSSTAVPVVFRSDDYPSLNAGYWVIALVNQMTEEQAAGVCRGLSGADVCYQRWLGDSAP